MTWFAIFIICSYRCNKGFNKYIIQRWFPNQREMFAGLYLPNDNGWIIPMLINIQYFKPNG